MIHPNLQVKFRKKANLVVNDMIKLELSDPMSTDYYRGYMAGLSDSPSLVCTEAFDLLKECLTKLEDHNISEKIVNFLNGSAK